MKASTPQVKGNTCTDPDKPLYPVIKVGSEAWSSWLREPNVRSFHFENDQGKFTARKEERATSTNEYWYAYRKVQGKLRKVYLGSMDELTSDRLNQVAAEISQPGSDYYYSRKSYTTAKQKHCVTVNSETNGYPTGLNQDWVTDNSELEALKAEVDQMRSQLKTVNQERDILKLDQERTEDALGKLIDKIYGKQKGYMANSFTQGIKDITQLAESKGL